MKDSLFYLRRRHKSLWAQKSAKSNNVELPAVVTPLGTREPKVAFISIQPKNTKKVNNVFVSYYKDIPHVPRIVTRTHG